MDRQKLRLYRNFQLIRTKRKADLCKVDNIIRVFVRLWTHPRYVKVIDF